MECDARIPHSRRPIDTKDGQTGDKRSYSVSPIVIPGESLSQALKNRSPADNLEPHFRPWTDPSVAADIEIFDAALRSYFLTTASEHNLTNHEEVQEAVIGVNVSKASDPDDIPNRVLKLLSQRAVSLLIQIFNALLLTHHFPSVWKHE